MHPEPIEVDENEVIVTDDDEMVYEEDDCNTDNEEEVAHDLITCPECSTKTHYLNEECGKCQYKFKISKTGYVLTGEDGDFICDEDEKIEVMSEDGYETPDIDKMSVPDESDDSDSMSESDDDDEEDEEVFCDDEEIEYTSKKDINHVLTAPRRITRSMVRS